ncbi:SLOG family protein [Singulisphaera sp. PoT]|uniref:SLOG family protein n=1 Tax=Singulisphaera sp. PoT TaxID=3411797 RepID=UPI003BF52944
MRVIITGDRNWYDPDLAESVLNRLLLRYGPSLTIVHGAGGGIDRSFAEACRDLDLEQESHPAHWEELDHPAAVVRQDRKGRPYNANAGPIRNAEMVAAGAEMCIAFHRAISSSKGTKDCARQAIAAGIPTYLIDSERAVPRRLGAGDPRLK